MWLCPAYSKHLVSFLRLNIMVWTHILLRWFCASHRFIWSQPNQQDSHNDFLLYQLLLGWKLHLVWLDSTSVWLEVLLERSSFVGTRIMSKKSNTVRNLRFGPRVPVRPEWVGFGGENLMKLYVQSYTVPSEVKGVLYRYIYFWGPSHTFSAIWDWMSRVFFRPQDGESCPRINLIESFSESFPSQVQQVSFEWAKAWLFLCNCLGFIVLLPNKEYIHIFYIHTLYVYI